MKKRFPCNHSGKGTFCHRCGQAVALLDAAKKEKDSAKATALKADADRLLALPKRVGGEQMPSAPVPV
jgi:hypothetical protein